MNRNAYIILVLFLTVNIILTLYHPGGLLAYIVPSLCWATIALTTLTLSGGLNKIRSWTNRRITLMAMLIAVFQIFILIDVGLITKFGRSPLSFTPTGITINLILVSSTLLGMELSRGYLTKNLNRKKPTLTLAAITLLYTFTNVSVFALINFQNPLLYSKLMGEMFLPILTENLLATYLALLAGPLASLAYRAPLQAFKWFSPILPDLPWGYKALIGVMAPTIGFIAINMATTHRDLLKAGIPTQSRPVPRLRKSRNSMKGWLAISIFMVLTVWASTGLLGFYPTIVASGSMRPTLDVGDIAITVQTRPEAIKVGDIIQYWRQGGPAPIIHRVIEIYKSGGTTYLVTKGDANTAPDDPITPARTVGKVVFAIPKLGWASIYIKAAIANAITFFTNNLAITYTTITIASATSVFGIHRYRNQPLRKLRRRLKR